jgi:hypothetical protein
MQDRRFSMVLLTLRVDNRRKQPMHPAAVASAALTQQQQGQCRRLATRPLQLIFAQNVQMSRMLLYEIPMARKA